MAAKKKLELASSDEYMRILWYGDFGSGKTTDAANMAKKGPVCYIDAEGRYKASALESHGIPVGNIKAFKPDGYDQMEELFWKLDGLPEGKRPFGLVWDSTTDSQQDFLEEVITRKIERTLAKNRNADVDPFQANRDDRTRVNEMVRRMVRRFHNLPMHLGLVARLRVESEDEEGNDIAPRYVPGLTPGVRGDVGGYMDIVCYCRVVEMLGETEYQGLFVPSERWAAKDQYRKLPKLLIDPTFERIQDYVEGRLTVETDPVMEAAKERRAKSDEPRNKKSKSGNTKRKGK